MKYFSEPTLSQIVRASGNLGRLAAIGVLGMIASYASAKEANNPCGSLYSIYGPFDYRTDRDKLPVVETRHFTPQVELLVRGQTGTLPGPDLDYTLSKFPNHHRALISLVKLGDKLKTEHPPGMAYSVECYFERGLRFRANDNVVRLMYAQFLSNRKRSEEAMNQLSLARVFAKDNAMSHYNIGLVYMDMEAFDKAQEQAILVKQLGYFNPFLEEKLRQAGHWNEAIAAEPRASSPASASSPSTGP